MADGMRTVLQTTIEQIKALDREIVRLTEQRDALVGVKDGIERYLSVHAAATTGYHPGTEPRGKDAVRIVMSEQPDRVWTVPEIRDSVLNRGWIEPSPRVLEAVRTNLVRAIERWPDKIVQVDRGRYTYRSTTDVDGPTEMGPSTALEQQGGGDPDGASVIPLAR